MRIPDSWSFRQRPTGAFKRVLRVPVYLYHRRLRLEVAIQVRNKRWIPSQRFLDDDEAARRFARYESAHPRTARRLLDLMGNSYDGTDAGRVAMMAHMPMVAFTHTRPPLRSSREE